MTDELEATIQAGGVVRLAEAYPALPAGEALDAIAIPVEHIPGPVLLVSAADDGMWDSTGFSEVAASRLKAAGRPVEHLVFEGAGHLIAGPPSGSQTGSRSPGPGVTFETGGDPAVTTAARDQAWRRTVGFFQDALT